MNVSNTTHEIENRKGDNNKKPSMLDFFISIQLG